MEKQADLIYYLTMNDDLCLSFGRSSILTSYSRKQLIIIIL